MPSSRAHSPPVILPPTCLPPLQLHEYYRDEAVLYLIEEYCSGGTLEALVEKKGPQQLTA